MATGAKREILQVLKRIEREKKSTKAVPRIWYNKAELCRYFGISYTTLVRWQRHKDFPLLEMKNVCNGRFDVRKVEHFILNRSELT